jgi:hypothetical protein
MQVITSRIVFVPLFMGYVPPGVIGEDELSEGLEGSQGYLVLSLEKLLNKSSENGLMNGVSVVALYLPPWSFWLYPKQSEASFDLDMEAWMKSVRLLLSSRKVMRQNLRFVEVLNNNENSFVENLSGLLDLDKEKVLDALSPLFSAFETRVPQPLLPLLESFFREHFKDLTDLHDAVLTILDGGGQSNNDPTNRSSGVQAKVRPLKELESLSEWHSAVYQLQIEQARKWEQEKLQAELELKSSEQEKVQAELKLKSAEEESELLLLQLHQVQEELESYYLANKDLKNILTKSGQTIGDARRLMLTE